MPDISSGSQLNMECSKESFAKSQLMELALAAEKLHGIRGLRDLPIEIFEQKCGCN